RIWLVVVVIFTFVALYPIWSVRFIPLQDYPEHLLQAHMFSHRNDPAFDYNENFDFNLRLAPYATFYAVLIPLSAILPIEVAGKVAVSLYIFAVALLVIRLKQRFKTDFAPWGLLLLFPFAFNQQYFQGNINYLYSLPLLAFALLDHEDISNTRLSIGPLCRHFLWQLALFFTHPLTFLIYVSLASSRAVLSWRNRDEFVRGVIPPIIAAALFLLWFTVENAGGSAGRMWWKPFSSTLAWYGYIFTGMRWFDGVDKLSIVLWMGIGALGVHAFLAGRQEVGKFSIRCQAFFILTIIAVFVLPFGKGPYSFISVRVASVSYFFLAILVGRLKFKGVWRSVFILFVAAVLIQSVIKQGRVSAEIQEIVPIVERIPPNSRILPLVFDNDSPELENSFDMHLHDHDYYHLLVGGGLSPYIIKNPLFPVYYKAEVNLSAPGEYTPGLFKWEEHSAEYEYFMIRAAPDAMIEYQAEKMKLMDRSGSWCLFKKAIDDQRVLKDGGKGKTEGEI
ncbi:MAG: hypothetical protein ABUK14_03660, partial [Desulfobacteria bacterium]